MENNILDELLAIAKDNVVLNSEIFWKKPRAIGIFKKRNGQALVVPFQTILSVCPTIKNQRENITEKVVFRKTPSGEWEVYTKKCACFNLVPDLNTDQLEKGWIAGYKKVGRETTGMQMRKVD